MKIKILLLIFLIISSYLTIDIYKKIDKQLFNYGRSSLKHESNLPFGLIPDYWGYDQGMLWFVLLDSTEVTYIAQKSEFEDSIFYVKIDSVISYTYDSKQLIAKVKDINGTYFYIIESINGTIITNNKNNEIDQYLIKPNKWYNVYDEQIINNITSKRALPLWGVIFSLLSTIGLLLILLKNLIKALSNYSKK